MKYWYLWALAPVLFILIAAVLVSTFRPRQYRSTRPDGYYKHWT